MESSSGRGYSLRPSTRDWTGILAGLLALSLLFIADGCGTEGDAFDANPLDLLNISRVNPPDGAFGIDPTTHITVGFPVPMDSRTINRQTLLLSESTPTTLEKQRLVGVQVLYDAANQLATLIPFEPLRENTPYQVLIQDARSLDRDFFNTRVATFSTGSFTNRLPRVDSIRPVSGQAEVPVTSTIVLTFDQIMDGTSVLDAILVSPSVPVTASFEQVPVGATVGTRATLTPNLPLPASQTVVVTVLTLARTPRGLHLAEPFVSSFFVESTPRVLTQTVFPFDNATDIQTNATVTLDFSTQMDVTSLSQAFSLRFGTTVLDQNDGNLTLTTVTTDFFNPVNTSPPRTRLSYIPTAPLPATTSIQIRIDGAARSVRGLSSGSR